MSALPKTVREQQIDKFEDTLRQLEKNLWNDRLSHQSISYYQQTFRDYEILLNDCKDVDNRAHFIITIPVADRPKQLHNCMQSILDLCELYNYGGFQDGFYNKVSIVIADDSATRENITHNKSLCHQYRQSGLNVTYFGLTEQIKIIHSLPGNQRQDLEFALGNTNGKIDESNFSHKGASIMRNITYIYLQELSKQHNNALIYFIDSDQQFCVNYAIDNDEQNIYAINYFHHINEIFANTKTEFLTGKVVGDPPVSPSVMAAKFLDDVIAFIEQASLLPPESNCEFHAAQQYLDDASYHDMADLFGFASTGKTHDYHCSLTGKHSNHDCLLNFSSRLNNFFHGEHPTRSTQFTYTDSLSTTTPARTVYTGNYIFKPVHLKRHIAFANLHLRMAGPTFGRLLEADIGEKFSSANLPMLHSRTINGTGESEFRHSIAMTSEHIDLSDEFERQYFGDIMLFTIDALIKSGFPQKNIPDEKITDTLNMIEKKIHNQYMDKHFHIIKQTNHLKTILDETDYWTRPETNMSPVINHLITFLSNIDYNFGEKSIAYQLINDVDIKQGWLNKLKTSISSHCTVSDTWKQSLQ